MLNERVITLIICICLAHCISDYFSKKRMAGHIHTCWNQVSKKRLCSQRKDSSKQPVLKIHISLTCIREEICIFLLRSYFFDMQHSSRNNKFELHAPLKFLFQ